MENVTHLSDIEFDGLENFAGYLISKLGLTQFGYRTHEKMDIDFTYVNLLSEGGLYKPNREFLNILEQLNSKFIEFNGTTLNDTGNYMQNLLSNCNVILEEKIAKRFFLGRTYFRIRHLNRNLKDSKLTNAKKKLKKTIT